MTDELKEIGFLEKVDSLEKEFQIACRDNHFCNLVNSISLSPSILKKYTSLLEESSIEYNHCCECKNLLECKNKQMGYAYLPTVLESSLLFQYQACRFKKKQLEESSYLENIEIYHMPKEILSAKMKNIFPDENRLPVIKWLKVFLNQYPKVQKGLYLHGNFGCGKSYLVAALFNELAVKKVKSAIVFWPEFLRDLKSSFGIDFNQKFQYVKTVPLLLIDDIGAENMTNWSRDEILCPIVQYRMDEKLPTFFTSNLDFKCLEEHLSISKDGVDSVKARRILERIKQLTDEVELVSKNLRK